MKIVVDTREQLPYHFQTASVKGTLATGDYSLLGLEDLIAIERKTLPDLISCLCSGRGRFERELHRGKALDYFALIVEATLTDIAKGDYRSQMRPKAAIQSILAFSIRYRLPVFFVENRNFGARVTESLLLKYAKEVEKRAEAIQQMAA
jgi:ERCC4-type nuclease